MPLRVRRGRPVWVRLSVCLCHCAASFTYFGEVIRCPHKRIVTITKVYIARNNIHVELITIPYKLARLVTFESLKWKYSFATNSTLSMKLGSLLYVRCRHRSVKSSSFSNKTFLFQLTNIYLFWGSVTLSTLTHRHYNESVHCKKQHTRGINNDSIQVSAFSDI